MGKGGDGMVWVGPKRVGGGVMMVLQVLDPKSSPGKAGVAPLGYSFMQGKGVMPMTWAELLSAQTPHWTWSGSVGFPVSARVTIGLPITRNGTIFMG